MKGKPAAKKLEILFPFFTPQGCQVFRLFHWNVPIHLKGVKTPLFQTQRSKTRDRKDKSRCPIKVWTEARNWSWERNSPRTLSNINVKKKKKRMWAPFELQHMNLWTSQWPEAAASSVWPEPVKLLRRSQLSWVWMCTKKGEILKSLPTTQSEVLVFTDNS